MFYRLFALFSGPFTLCSRPFTFCSSLLLYAKDILLYALCKKWRPVLFNFFFYPLSFKTSNYQIFQFPSWSTCFWYPACACTLKNWLEWLILWVLSKLISWWFKPRLNISYGGWVIDFFSVDLRSKWLSPESRE